MNETTALARNLLAWLVPFAIVVAALGFETDWGRSVGFEAPAGGAAPPQPVEVALLPEYGIDGGLEARKETVDRVLFNPTRRPAPPATQSAADAATMKRGLYTLTGTTVVGNVATAFLREVNGGKSRSVRQGETLGGMLVAEVKPDHVRLKQGAEFEDLQLKIASGPKTTVQPAVVTTAPAPAAAPAAGGATAAGGSGAATPGRPQTRRVAPPPAAPATPRAGSPSVSELLAERRRAARAAAEGAAAAGQSRGVVPQQR
jgi:hypothetical protein